MSAPRSAQEALTAATAARLQSMARLGRCPSCVKLTELIAANGNVLAFTVVAGALGKWQMGHCVARIIDAELCYCRFASVPPGQNADGAQPS